MKGEDMRMWRLECEYLPCHSIPRVILRKTIGGPTEIR